MLASFESILFFAKYYLPQHIPDDIPQLHKDWLATARREQYIAFAAPRGHAKSTIYSLVYPLWCILHKRKNFIVLISDSSSQASELLGSIVQELETNERIIEDFGRIAGYIPPTAKEKSKWTASDIVTLTGVKVIAVGWKSRLRGRKYKNKRPDLILLDDVENDENIESPEQRKKVHNVFRKSILNIGDETTQVIVIGTILHYDSLLSNLINYPPEGFYVKLYRAIENNEALWPDKWSIEKLEDKKAQIGAIPFEQEYMNNPLDPETQIIKPVAFYTDPLNLAEYDCFSYLDLAISEKQTADYTAIVTAARHRTTGKIKMIDPQRKRGGILEILSWAMAYYKIYHHVVFGVESVAYQKAFAQILQDESTRSKMYIPIKEIEVDKDKVRRVLEISPHIENGTVEFSPSHQDYLAELQQFPKGSHDDWVDATSGAIKLALKANINNFVRSGRGIKYPNNS